MRASPGFVSLVYIPKATHEVDLNDAHHGDVRWMQVIETNTTA